MQPAPEPRRHPQVVNIDELSGHTTARDSIASTMKQLAAAAGGHGLGCTCYEVPPGRSAFPRHFHCVNEEALFVLDGAGTLRLGERDVPVRAGDYVALPAGPRSGHQLVNTGAVVLRYLCLSTLQPTDVIVYPDAGTVGVMAAPTLDAARRGEHWVCLMTADGAADGVPGGEGGG
ncbi:cupin domain-containing protein [Sorangium sp. So ce134]